jgi:hypothetical protein
MAVDTPYPVLDTKYTPQLRGVKRNVEIVSDRDKRDGLRPASHSGRNTQGCSHARTFARARGAHTPGSNPIGTGGPLVSGSLRTSPDGPGPRHRCDGADRSCGLSSRTTTERGDLQAIFLRAKLALDAHRAGRHAATGDAPPGTDIGLTTDFAGLVRVRGTGRTDDPPLERAPAVHAAAGLFQPLPIASRVEKGRHVTVAQAIPAAVACAARAGRYLAELRAPGPRV